MTSEEPACCRTIKNDCGHPFVIAGLTPGFLPGGDGKTVMDQASAIRGTNFG